MIAPEGAYAESSTKSIEVLYHPLWLFRTFLYFPQSRLYTSSFSILASSTSTFSFAYKVINIMSEPGGITSPCAPTCVSAHLNLFLEAISPVFTYIATFFQNITSGISFQNFQNVQNLKVLALTQNCCQQNGFQRINSFEHEQFFNSCTELYCLNIIREYLHESPLKCQLNDFLS
ncbi:Hypothetical_protein [Hexamita inflata]|uniref:Hypothetical_protein n=1 Tax=Hexamita inflata TaxID=28002 RepID=A0AA86RAW9_9EUKA|nr:Hypothetical protein HINF_LOCUS57247 [Hexamita inflata]